MKKLICALLSVFLISPCVAEVHIAPDVVTSAIATHFPNRQVETLTEYNSQLRASNGNGISGTGLWNVCAAGDLNIKQAMDKGKCQAFANYLAQSKKTKFFAVCGEDKNTPGGKCVQDFSDLTVNAQQAEGLAKLYASIKSDDVQCNENVRKKTGPLGRMLPTYLQCSSNISKNFYEFQFNNTDGNIDKVNHSNFKKGICKLFNSDFTTKDLYGHTWDICSDINDEKACEKIDSFVRNANIGYIATWGPAWYTLGDRGYEVTSTSLPYCVLSETIIKGNDGTILIEHTAFGLDGRVFLAGIQRKGSQEIKAQIRSYVENVMGKENVKSFSCEDNYHTVKLKGRSGNDDLLQCVVNGELVDFFFDDLSEAWGVYDKSGREGMTCATWGGTFTGKRCIGLEDEKTCNTIRDANKELCPECKQITWNEKTKTCNLPSSVTANALRKGLNYTAIVGGATVSVVITVGTLGTATVPTAVVLTGLAVETLGAGVELVAQAKINHMADNFFIESSNCNDAQCAEELLKENLQRLSNIAVDLTESEQHAADKELTRLITKLSPTSTFLTDIVMGDSLIDANHKSMFDSESWESEQVWRAVGIAMQMVTVFASVGKWVLTKTGFLKQALPNATEALASKAKLSREEIRKMVSEGKPIKLSNGTEITVPKGRLAATVATIDGTETDITGKTKYAIINALDDWMEKNGDAVKVQYDKNLKAIYSVGIRDDAMQGIEQWLRTNRVPYSKNGNYIKILETDLERTGAFAISADDPMITQLIKEFGDDAVMRALDNATSKEAMERAERAVNEIMENRATVNIIFKGAIDTKALETYASTVKQRYLQIIANDNELTTYALRFDELDTAQKEAFANKILRKYNSGVCDGGVCRVDPELVELSGTQKNGIIQISEPHNSSLDDFMNTLAHENNHFHDESASGFLNYEQSRLGSAMAGDFTDDIDIYNTNLTEHASDVIGKTVGQGFTSELNKMIKTLH